MIFKLNLQLFGGSPMDAANEAEGRDLQANNDMYDFKVGNTTYSVPIKAYANVGNNPAVSYASRMKFAAIYTAYMLSNEKTELVYNPSITNSTLYSNIETWYKEETGEKLSDVLAMTDAASTMSEMRNPHQSFRSSMPSYIENNSIKVDNKPYNTWLETAPQFQPGYDKTLGAPVAKDKDGNYVYKNDNGEYVYLDGNSLQDDATLYNTKTDETLVIGLDGALRDAVTGEVVGDPNSKPITSPKETAFNQYYNDIHSLRDGTLGKSILDSNISLYEKEAANAQLIAEASMQQQAIAQAQAVQQVTDSLRSERMAQLRSGMSEAQLADRELNMLIGSANQLSMQATQSAQDVLTAKVGANTAREQAFTDYITQSTALGQNAAATYAAEAGDLHAQAVKYQQQLAAEGITVTYKDAVDVVSGNKYRTNNGG